jgi:hypothetical protein
MSGEFGAAISNVGNMLMGIGKDKMLAKMEADKENRAEERAKAREERERLRKLNEVDKSRNIQTPDGKWMRQDVNMEGKVLNEEPLDAGTIDQLNYESTKRKYSLDAFAHDAAMDKLEDKYAEPEKQADIAYKNAQTGREQAYAGYQDARTVSTLTKDPNAPKQKAYAPPKVSAPSRQSIESAFGKKGADGKMVIDEKAYGDFRKWKAKQQEADPEYRSGEFSLEQYMAGNNARVNISINGGPTVPVAAGAEDTAAGLEQVILDRRKSGKPDLSRDQLIEMGKQHLATGAMQEPNGKSGGGGSKGGHPKVPAAAVEALRKDPSLYKQFVAKYGEAAAKAILGK